jgi:hypothetical protein
MSAYYLKQVVREWSLGTIYKGMFEFMALQCIAVALMMIFPQIATFLPEQMRTEATAQQTEPVDNSASRLEEDPLGENSEHTGEAPGAPGTERNREESAR